jgi:hypothetical protein
MPAPENDFSTFCHISEYATDQPGEDSVDGYANLHRMVAVSRQLNLWAPSSYFLLKPDCRISARDFVSLVESNAIRVLGREAWIRNSAQRTRLADRWPGARWDAQIDGAILAIHLSEERANTPPPERRVVVAPPECGYDAAKELLGDHPEWADTLYQAFESPSTRRIPIGIRETVLRDLEDLKHGLVPIEVAVARTILRDAKNHADAMTLSGAHAPFLLSSDDTDFLDFLGQLHAPMYAYGESDNTRGPQIQARLGSLTREVISLVTQMDDLRDRLHSLEEDRSILAWIGSEGHRLITAWLLEMCRVIGNADDGAEDESLVDLLRHEITRGWMKSGRTVNRSHEEKQLRPVDAMEELSIRVLGKGAAFGLSDVGMEDLPRGGGLTERLGWIRAEYNGPQWPYLYIFGKRATRRRRQTLLRELRR